LTQHRTSRGQIVDSHERRLRLTSMSELNGHSQHPMVTARWIRDGRSRKTVGIDAAAAEVASVMRIDAATIKRMLLEAGRVETGWSVWELAE